MAVLFGMDSFAQKLQIVQSVNGETQVVAEGATVVLQVEKDPFFGKLQGNSGSLAVLNTDPSSTYACTTTFSLVSNTMGATSFQTCQGGLCSNFSSFPYVKSYSVGGGETSTFQYEAAPSQYGEMTTQIVVEGAGERHTFNLQFVYQDPTAIAEVPSVAANYTVFDMAGHCVAENVSTFATLKSGLYMVRDNHAYTTQKIIIQ